MAVRNHSLDRPIEEAAKADFLEYGFEKASMRRIAERAGVTHGALYTRAGSKDELFVMLVSPLLRSIEGAFTALRGEYFGNEALADPAAFLRAMEHENSLILRLLFDDYDLSRLLLVRSHGSSLEDFFSSIVELKIKETLEFFRLRKMESPDPGVLRMLISSEFSTFRDIIEEGWSLEYAERMMKSILKYHEAGWKALLDI